MSMRLSAKRSRLAAIAARSMQTAAAKPQLGIRNVTARAVKEPGSGRQYVLLKIDTDSGVSGWGETSAAPDAATAVARFATFRSLLLTQDALASQTVEAHLARASAPAGVRAAVNMALLDILGKVAKAPVYEVLAGRTRNKARALAPLQGADRAALLASLERARARGFRAFVVDVQMPTGPVRGR